MTGNQLDIARKRILLFEQGRIPLDIMREFLTPYLGTPEEVVMLAPAKLETSPTLPTVLGYKQKQRANRQRIKKKLTGDQRSRQ